jgi:5'-nucleotidase
MTSESSTLLTIGVSSRALFDLSVEDEIFMTRGLEAFTEYQLEHESELLNPGVAFPLVKAILQLNRRFEQRKAEVVIMSRNSAETSLRIFNSITHYGLDISRAALCGGESLAPYLQAFNITLFLSQHTEDVEKAVEAGFPAAVVYPESNATIEEIEQIRIAFDGDAVLFSEESERIFQEQGLEAFTEHERQNASNPLPEGPFAKLLRALASIQSVTPPGEDSPIRTALVTARGSPAHERVIRTLRAWNIHIDEAFFLGGMPKGEILRAFNPHMFFDDHAGHCTDAGRFVPTGRVPSKVRK